MSVFDDLSRARAQLVWDGVHGRTVHGKRITLALVELDPGAHVREHSHANEQVGILLFGRAEFVVGGERRMIEPGGCWCILGHVLHEVTAGTDGAVLVECFSPPRADWADLPWSPTENRLPA
jgi:quercetin dioxygenase-like cupin family protein